MRDRRDYWLGHIAAFRDSGETLRAYCERHDLTAITFRKWRLRLDGDTAPGLISEQNKASPGGSRERSETLLRPFPTTVRGPERQQIVDLLTRRTVRRRWSVAEKQHAVLDALRSGLPMERFARQNGLTPSALHRWTHQFARRNDADVPGGAGTDGSPSSWPASAPLPSTPTFAAVTITALPVPVSCDAEPQRVEIVLNNGRRVHVGLGVDMVALQRLVAALEPAA